MKKGKEIVTGETINMNGQTIKLGRVTEKSNDGRWFVYFSECMKNEMNVKNEETYEVI